MNQVYLLSTLHAPFMYPFLYIPLDFTDLTQTKHCWQNYVDYHKYVSGTIDDSYTGASMPEVKTLRRAR
jgi:hypothetical protein